MAAALNYFVYSSIPGAGKGWTLAVLAISRYDADVYMRIYHKGSKFIYQSKSPDANCGAVTVAAGGVLRAKNEAE